MMWPKTPAEIADDLAGTCYELEEMLASVGMMKAAYDADFMAILSGHVFLCPSCKIWRDVGEQTPSADADRRYVCLECAEDWDS